MTKLDETGLAAARLAFLRSTGSDPLLDALAAYLAATRTSNVLRDLQRLGQECGQDRLAVVVSAVREHQRGSARLLKDGDAMAEEDWQDLEAWVDAEYGPLRRQIVRCNLLRPEPVGEIVGSVEG